MPSQYPEVAISRRIHLWERKSASNWPCETSNAWPDRCRQEPWILLALWGRADVVTARTFLRPVCPAVGCPGQGSRRPGLGWCRRSNGERRNWLFPLGCTTGQGCWSCQWCHISTTELPNYAVTMKCFHWGGDIGCLPSLPYHCSCMSDQLLLWHNAAYSVYYTQREISARLWNARAYTRRSILYILKAYTKITL